MHFLDLISDDQAVTLVLGRQVLRVERRRLGSHLRLAMIGSDVWQAIRDRDARHLSARVTAYLLEAGVAETIIEATPGAHLLRAFLRLLALNTLKQPFPWMDEAAWGPQAGTARIVETGYDGRQWARWIHKLASRYGWSRETIMNLWPEEAAVYLTEIYLSEWEEMEAERRLSQTSYRYDKGSKMNYFVPIPKPPWMLERQPEEIRKAEAEAWEKAKKTSGEGQMLPAGVIMDWEAVLKKQEELKQ